MRDDAPVVVGFDGSDGARRALDWAADEAARRGAALKVAVCTDWHPVASPEAGGAVLTAPDLHELGEQLAHEAVTRAQQTHPGLEVPTAVRSWSPPVPALLEEGGRAQLLVLGSRGRGTFADLVLGSTSAQVAVHASCPVVVVRPPAPGEEPADHGPVVVGVDTSALAREALAFAVRAAELRGARVLAVRAWQAPSLWGSSQHRPGRDEVEALQRVEETVVDEVLTSAGARCAVERRVVRGHPADVLLTAARGASLLVVGSRGAGGFRGLLLGSTSRAVIHHAHCPVAVVHHR